MQEVLRSNLKEGKPFAFFDLFLHKFFAGRWLKMIKKLSKLFVMYQLVLNLTKIFFFICWLCNKLKKILLFSFEKNSVVGGIRTHAHKSETKWRWENLFSPKKIFSNAIFPHTTHSYTYPTYSKWKILPESF